MGNNPIPGGRESALGAVEPLSPDQFYVLYQGVLEAESEREFYRDAALVLGVGRLGLRPETLLHLHEGWVDWTTGSVVVPAHDPCACEACLATLGEDPSVSGGDHLGVLCQDEFFRPPTASGARSVPFWWSRRVTAVLMEFFDRFEYPEFEGSPAERLTDLASRVPGLDPDAVSIRALRASAARTFADLGLDGGALRDVMGVDSTDDVRRFVRQGRSWGETDPLVPGHAFRSTYRVVGNPAAFADEPCDPTAFGAESRELRDRRNAPTSEPVGNPRPPASSVSVDPSMRADAAAYLDPDSELLSLGEDSAESFVGAWVRRHDSREDASTVTPEPVAGSGRTAGEDPRSPGDDTVPDPAVGDGGSTASGATPSESGTADPPSPGVGADPADDTPEGPEMRHASLREVVENPVADFPARYVSTLVTGGEPVTGHVVVEPDRVVFDVSDAPVQEGAGSFVVPHGSVTDFSFDYDQDTTEAFGDGVALAISWDATRESIAVEFDGDDNEFAANLLTQVFDGRGATVSYPVREGGRVNEDVSTRPATLGIRGSTIVVEGEDDTVVEIDLSDVSTVDRASQVYDGESVPSVEVEFAVEGATETARVGFRREGRLTKLFSKLAKVHYRHQRRKMRSLSLSDAEKECLVALHSMGGSTGGMDISGMIGVDDFDALMEGLHSKGLLEADGEGSKLTGIGRTVVTEKIDDVNF